MGKERTNICAGIITYEPELSRLQENIEAIIGQVSTVFIVDNDSEHVEKIERLASRYEEVTLIKNSHNMGIAKALNQLIAVAKEQHYPWIITLDQDSVCYRDLVSNYLRYLDQSIGMLICDIIDRNYTLKTNVHREPAKAIIEDVEKCITSGCCTNVDAVLSSGGFDEKLFIDMVDYDMCYSLREHGYRIVNAHFTGLLHEVGKSRKYNILGFEFAVNNHSAERKYTISRNSVYLIKKHKLNPIPEYALIFRRILTAFLFENDKLAKIKAILKGVSDGWKMQKSL